MREGAVGGGDEGLSEGEVLIPKIHYPRLCNWRKLEFETWKHLFAQGHGMENFENDVPHTVPPNRAAQRNKT